MAVYIVTYDLNKETVRPKITKAIKDFPGWAKLSESSYAVLADGSPDDVYGSLVGFLDENDQLYVISLQKPYSGQGDDEVNKWLEAQLPW